MVVRILVILALIVLGAGFIFFAGNVIWLGTKEFFRIYGPKKDESSKPVATPIAPTIAASSSTTTTSVAP